MKTIAIVGYVVAALGGLWALVRWESRRWNERLRIEAWARILWPLTQRIELMEHRIGRELVLAFVKVADATRNAAAAMQKLNLAIAQRQGTEGSET